MPRCGRVADGRRLITSISTRSASPGRTGVSQRTSTLPPIPPPATGNASVISRLAVLAVCQPLATSSPNALSAAVSSPTWPGCGVELVRERDDVVTLHDNLAPRAKNLTRREVLEIHSACHREIP